MNTRRDLETIIKEAKSFLYFDYTGYGVSEEKEIPKDKEKEIETDILALMPQDFIDKWWRILFPDKEIPTYDRGDDDTDSFGLTRSHWLLTNDGGKVVVFERLFEPDEELDYDDIVQSDESSVIMEYFLGPWQQTFKASEIVEWLEELEGHVPTLLDREATVKTADEELNVGDEVIAMSPDHKEEFRGTVEWINRQYKAIRVRLQGGGTEIFNSYNVWKAPEPTLMDREAMDKKADWKEELDEVSKFAKRVTLEYNLECADLNRAVEVSDNIINEVVQDYLADSNPTFAQIWFPVLMPGERTDVNEGSIYLLEEWLITTNDGGSFYITYDIGADDWNIRQPEIEHSAEAYKLWYELNGLRRDLLSKWLDERVIQPLLLDREASIKPKILLYIKGVINNFQFVYVDDDSNRYFLDIPDEDIDAVSVDIEHRMRIQEFLNKWWAKWMTFGDTTVPQVHEDQMDHTPDIIIAHMIHTADGGMTELIERGAGRRFRNVANTDMTYAIQDYFRSLSIGKQEEFIKELYAKEGAHLTLLDREAGQGGGSTHPLYESKCPKCGSKTEVTATKLVGGGGQVTCPKGHKFTPTKFTPKSEASKVQKKASAEESALLPNLKEVKEKYPQLKQLIDRVDEKMVADYAIDSYNEEADSYLDHSDFDVADYLDDEDIQFSQAVSIAEWDASLEEFPDLSRWQLVRILKPFLVSGGHMFDENGLINMTDLDMNNLTYERDKIYEKARNEALDYFDMRESFTNNKAYREWAFADYLAGGNDPYEDAEDLPPKMVLEEISAFFDKYKRPLLLDREAMNKTAEETIDLDVDPEKWEKELNIVFAMLDWGLVDDVIDGIEDGAVDAYVADYPDDPDLENFGSVFDYLLLPTSRDYEMLLEAKGNKPIDNIFNRYTISEVRQIFSDLGVLKNPNGQFLLDREASIKTAEESFKPGDRVEVKPSSKSDYWFTGIIKRILPPDKFFGAEIKYDIDGEERIVPFNIMRLYHEPTLLDREASVKTADVYTGDDEPTEDDDPSFNEEKQIPPADTRIKQIDTSAYINGFKFVKDHPEYDKTKGAKWSSSEKLYSDRTGWFGASAVLIEGTNGKTILLALAQNGAKMAKNLQYIYGAWEVLREDDIILGDIGRPSNRELLDVIGEQVSKKKYQIENSLKGWEELTYEEQAKVAEMIKKERYRSDPIKVYYEEHKNDFGLVRKVVKPIKKKADAVDDPAIFRVINKPESGAVLGLEDEDKFSPTEMAYAIAEMLEISVDDVGIMDRETEVGWREGMLYDIHNHEEIVIIKTDSEHVQNLKSSGMLKRYVADALGIGEEEVEEVEEIRKREPPTLLEREATVVHEEGIWGGGPNDPGGNPNRYYEVMVDQGDDERWFVLIQSNSQEWVAYLIEDAVDGRSRVIGAKKDMTENEIKRRVDKLADVIRTEISRAGSMGEYLEGTDLDDLMEALKEVFNTDEPTLLEREAMTGVQKLMATIASIHHEYRFAWDAGTDSYVITKEMADKFIDGSMNDKEWILTYWEKFTGTPWNNLDIFDEHGRVDLDAYYFSIENTYEFTMVDGGRFDIDFIPADAENITNIYTYEESEQADAMIRFSRWVHWDREAVEDVFEIKKPSPTLLDREAKKSENSIDFSSKCGIINNKATQSAGVL